MGPAVVPGQDLAEVAGPARDGAADLAVCERNVGNGLRKAAATWLTRYRQRCQPFPGDLCPVPHTVRLGAIARGTAEALEVVSGCCHGGFRAGGAAGSCRRGLGSAVAGLREGVTRLG